MSRSQLELRQRSAITRIAALVLVNAMMFEEVLAQKDERVRPLQVALVSRHAAYSHVHVRDGQHGVYGHQAFERRFDQTSVVGPLLQELGLKLCLFGDVTGAGKDAAHAPELVTEYGSIE